MRIVLFFAELKLDLRHGLRVLAALPGFTFVALLSLSLGIAIASCAYSEINGMILRDLPAVSHPEQLTTLQTPTSYPDYKRFRDLHDIFSSTMAYVAPVPFAVSLNGHTERTWGHLVTSTYFSTLGTHLALGKFADLPDVPDVLAISHRFWTNRLGSDPSIVGKTLRINGHPLQVVGVGPKDFLGASPALFVADLWIPISTGERIAPELVGNALERRDLTMFQMVGRLQPGISIERAEAELDTVARQVARGSQFQADQKQGRQITLLDGGKILPIRKQDLPFFKEFLMVLAGLVMLIACSNVANMMLARSAGRRREIAVRLALGAGRMRLVRQLLTENMLVAFAAGALGFTFSVWLMHWASQMRMPYPIPISFDMAPDARALAFTLAVTILTGLAFGLAPALEATRTDLVPALKEGAHVQLRGRRRLSLRNLLVLGQMAASLTLLLLTGYMGLGIQSSLGVQEGFNAKNLYLISLDPVRDGYSSTQSEAFFEKLSDRVKRIPGIAAAALTDTVPVAMDGNTGVTFSEAAKNAEARRHIVGKDYFATAGIPILSGREFRKEDESSNSNAVIVSEELVRKFWNGADALGRRIEIRNGEVSPGLGAIPGTFDLRADLIAGNRETYQVVGVAGDVTEDFVASKKHPVIYFPLREADYAQPSLRGVTLMFRAAPGMDAIGAVRREISAVDVNITPFNSRSMLEQIDQFMSPLRAASWTYGLIGVFGLILASVGLAGVTAYSVTQRGREIGIRMALGAQKPNVLGLVLKEGAVLIAVGTVFGLAAAWAGIRALSGMFFTVASVQRADPMLLAGAPLLLVSVALLACYLPARRSVKIDPAITLRQE